MIQRARFLSLGLAALVAVAASSSLDAQPTDGVGLTATKFELDNGLEVIVHEDHSQPTVMVHVWYHVGSKDEVEGRSGFAHLFEHLMFKGSKHVPDGDFDRLLEAAGGWNNGTTNEDRTNYFEQLPSNYLGLALYLEADRMAGLWDAMNQDVLDNQRDVVKNERRQSYENAPYGMAELAIQQALWPKGHGNHGLTIGTMEDLTAASLADVELFYRTYYVPNNATLVIAGDVDVDTVKKAVQLYFGWMPRRPEPSHVTLTAPVRPRSEETRMVLEDDVEVPQVFVTWRAPQAFGADGAELDIAAQVLASGKTSRLEKRLVFDERIASSVGAYQYPMMLGSMFQVTVMAKPGVEPDQLFMAVDEELARLAKEPPTDDEVLRARNTREARFVMGLESLAGRAGLLARYNAYLGDPNYFAKDLARYTAVTPKRVSEAVARWLKPDARVVTYVVPAKKGAK